MPDLSVLIPARQEQFLSRTIDAVLAAARADTEVIAVLDGEWADPPVADHPKVRLIYRPQAIGQRAATNLAARVSTARFVMKIDAHCQVDDGFDEKLIAPYDTGELGPDVTTIPAMMNLHAFNWKCRSCGRETYQGPTPLRCEAHQDRDRELAVMPQPCGQAAGFERVMVWEPRHRRAQGNGSPGAGSLARTEFWRFDHEMHFAYKGPRAMGESADAELADVMSSVGACFLMPRARFFELEGLDESHGSWGQFGTEVACKSWLSGGRQITNRRTYFSHMFRTQGGDRVTGFGFPYEIKPTDQEYARRYSQNLWYGNHFPKQVRPLSWMLEHFGSVKGWHEAGDGNETPERAAERLARLDHVIKAGRRFMSNRGGTHVGDDHDRSLAVQRDGVDLLCVESDGAGAQSQRASQAGPTVGVLYYSDCRGDERILSAVRRQIQRCVPAGWPLVSVTLAPLDFGQNIVLPLERGYVTLAKQILAGLEALETDLVFFVEHDVIYAPEHFQFRPLTRDSFWYNQHRWQVSADDGRAVHYRCSQTAGLCADRQLLLAHYQKRVAVFEREGYHRNSGFEPGSNGWSRALDPHGAEVWMSERPNIDVRHRWNLTKTRWSTDGFRNKSTCRGWTESDSVPGWGVTRGRFDAFLADLDRTDRKKGAA